FARALQTEYEEDCGVTFGKVPITAIARITRSVDGQEVPIGKDAAEAIRTALITQKMLEADGRLTDAFDPRKKDFKLSLPSGYTDLELAIIDLLAAHQIERHVRKDADEKPNHLKKEVALSPDFAALWDRIKPKTTYRVEFETDMLVNRAIAALKKMQRIEPPKIKVLAGRVEVRRGGVAAEAMSAAEERLINSRYAMP